ncbi:MAG TPA: sensor histidine kinase [Longimicrobiales bacterium]|nr:sensor histidine kinase [Longimicrobiales bacterium]
MRLHEFILKNREQILTEWETFAKTCAPASITMDVTALRDHASEMLTVIARDLMTAQDSHQQSEKSMGRAVATGSLVATAAEEHGSARAQSGFTMDQMVAEYRALRASVLRLRAREGGDLTAVDMEDLMRFNEAIDQSLAESVFEFNQDVEEAKEMFLAILGHDLRTPLGAIYTSATFMLDTDELEEPHLTLTSRIAASATRSVHMVGDLLDFTRSRLGGGIPVVRKGINVGKVVHDAVDEIVAAHPDWIIDVDTREEHRGEWDAARLSQAITNLIGNAGEHAPPGTPIAVDVQGGDDEVAITIHNRGAVIPGDQIDGIFNPMKIREGPATPAATGPTGSLGLGLYIAERIVHAHAGRIEVESTAERGTTFTVHLPRAI